MEEMITRFTLFTSHVEWYSFQVYLLSTVTSLRQKIPHRLLPVFFILCLLCLSLGLYAAFRFFKATFPAHYFSDAHYLFTILFLFSALQKSPVGDCKIFNLTYVTTCLSVDVTNVVSVFSISHAQACAP